MFRMSNLFLYISVIYLTENRKTPIAQISKNRINVLFQDEKHSLYILMLFLISIMKNTDSAYFCFLFWKLKNSQLRNDRDTL